MFFFAAFLADSRTVPARLVTAARLALAGAVLAVGLHAVAAMLVSSAPAAAERLTPLLLIAALPVVAFALATWLHFLRLLRGAAPQGTATDQREVPPDSKSSENTSEIPS